MHNSEHYCEIAIQYLLSTHFQITARAPGAITIFWVTGVRSVLESSDICSEVIKIPK
jgi:hypothetical protein